MNELSVLIRCSDDWRLFDCLKSIDAKCDVVVSLTPNKEIEAETTRLGYKFALSEKGNPAATTLAALPLLKNERVLLIDSDCVFFPGSLERLEKISRNCDIVRPKIEFESVDFSSNLTALAREFQYEYCGFVYEPGLVINIKNALPKIGGYLFSKFAPFTPDGELDYRIRNLGETEKPNIETDSMKTIRHAALPFGKHLFSYYRYGMSEVSRMRNLKQQVFWGIVKGLGLRYRKLVDGSYPLLTLPAIMAGDIVYFFSIGWHTIKETVRSLLPK